MFASVSSKLARPTPSKRFIATSRPVQEKVYLVNGRRTPFGKFGETLKDVTPVQLGVHASTAAMEASGVKPEQLDHVVIGNVCPSTTDTLYASRHIALKSGIPIPTPAYNVNRLCGSGIQAIVDAKHIIERGEAACVLAGGVENMSMVPHLTYGGRFGTRYGSLQVVDMLLESLNDKHTNCPMAITAENLAEQYNITREDVDQYSFQSHAKAAKANAAGHFETEVIEVQAGRKTINKDEHIRYDCVLEDMSKLRPSFKKGGTVTPGTASGIVDGAASVIVASETFVKENNLKPLAEILDWSVVGVEPTIMGIGPVPAIQQVLQKSGLSLKEIGLIEINEAFAAQVMACAKGLELDLEKLNIWGGATAIGHPLGATGVRISLTLARQLQQTNTELGIASACIGGGQGIAVLLKKA